MLIYHILIFQSTEADRSKQERGQNIDILEY